MSLSSWAETSAESFLSPLGDRWHHVRQSARQAEAVAAAVPAADRDLLIAAAYLHDIGYAPSIALTGFHPLDGARWVRDNGPSPRLARLVAHHSCAVYEAQVRGFLSALLAEFAPDDSATADALVYCDMTAGPAGDKITIENRIRDIYHRYPPDHPVSAALNLSCPALIACHDRTLARIQARAAYPIYGSLLPAR